PIIGAIQAANFWGLIPTESCSLSSEKVFGKDCRTSAAFDRPLRAPLVARVIVEGQDTGLALLKQGLRWVYEKYVGQASVEIQSRYRDAQHAAQAERAGLWQDPDRCRHWIGEKA